MVALSSFTNEIVLGAPGLPIIMAEHYLRNTAIDFCNRTKYIDQELAPVTVAAGVASSTLTVAAGEEIVEVILAYANGLPLEPVSEIQLQRDVGEWKTKSGTPTHFLSSGGTIRLYPIPTTDVTLVATVAKRPTRTSATLDDRLNDEWREAMVGGALANALMVPNQSYSNLELAAVQKQIYNDWVISAQAKAYKKTSYAPMRVQPV